MRVKERQNGLTVGMEVRTAELRRESEPAHTIINGVGLNADCGGSLDALI
jgi:hypothetical protein